MYSAWLFQLFGFGKAIEKKIRNMKQFYMNLSTPIAYTGL